MVIALVDDLLFSSKIRAAASAAGRSVSFVRNRAMLLPEIEARRPDLVIFDLDRTPLDPLGAIDEIRSRPDLAGIRLVAFVRHTNAEAIEAGRAASLDLVLARSAFFPALPEILAGETPGSAPA